MPRRDGTGPLGQGPMTGRGLGNCAGNESAGGWFGRGFGRRAGQGFGRGFGFGRGRGFYPANDPQSEKSWLDAAIEGLKNQLRSLEKRRNELND